MKKSSVLFVSAVIGACLVLLSLPDPLSAQEAGAASDAPIYEIVVTAPRMTVQETRRPMGGARVSMDYIVGFADLDLTRQSDRTELEERVREAAQEICELLTERYPGSQVSATACTREALRGAMARVREAIAAASR